MLRVAFSAVEGPESDGRQCPVTDGSYVTSILGLRGGVAAIFSIAVSAAHTVAGYRNASAELRYNRFVGGGADPPATVFRGAVAPRRIP